MRLLAMKPGARHRSIAITLLCTITALAAACVELSSSPELPGTVDSAPGAPQQSADELRFRDLLDVYRAQLDAAGVPGGALAIIRDGELAFAEGVGVRRQGSDESVDADTLFRVASTSKVVTAATLMALSEDGLVDLNAPITDYIPELSLLPPHDPSTIAVEHLLSHSAGIPDYFHLFECDATPGALARFFADRPNLTQWSPSGRLHNYSNLGYSLAALVAESASGQTFAALVEDRILRRARGRRWLRPFFQSIPAGFPPGESA